MFKFAEVVRKYLPLRVVVVVCLALLIGNYYPAVKAMKKIIPLVLFFMLFPMMITLKVEDIVSSFRDLKLSGIAILVNFLITPFLGALWAYLLFRNTEFFQQVRRRRWPRRP